MSRCGLRRRSLWLLGLILAGIGLASASVGAEPILRESRGRRLRIESVEREPGGGWRVRGQAPGPDGSVVLAQVQFGGVPGPAARAETAAERFDVRFPAPTARILAGVYVVRLEWTLRDQLPEVLDHWPGGFTPDSAAVEVRIGGLEEADRDRAQARERIANAVAGIHRLYRSLLERSEYLLAALAEAGRSSEAAATADRSWEAWAGLAEHEWEPQMRALGLDDELYRQRVFLPVFPSADGEVRQMLVMLQRLYAAIWAEVARAARKSVPARLESTPFRRSQLQAPLLDAANRVATALGLPPLDWSTTGMLPIESGDVTGDRYTSRESGFRVSRPAGWRFETGWSGPAQRLRILPPAADGEVGVMVVIEVRDVVEAKGPEELAERIEWFESERWSDFRKIDGRSLALPDPGDPSGRRSGLELRFLTTDTRGRFLVLEQHLFHRRRLRVTSVLCVGPPAMHRRYEREFREICDSLRVVEPSEADAGGGK